MGCFLFFSGDTSSSFIGAARAPASDQTRQLLTEAIAGSAPRGQTARTQHARALLESGKDLREHCVRDSSSGVSKKQSRARPSNPQRYLQMFNTKDSD